MKHFFYSSDLIYRLFYRNKMNVILCLIGLLYVFNCCVSEYEEYSVYEVIPEEDGVLAHLQAFFADTERKVGYDFWLPPTEINKQVHILSPPRLRKSLETFFNSINIKFKVIINDLAEELKKFNGTTPRSEFYNYTFKTIIGLG